MRALLHELADGFWCYVIACAAGLLVACLYSPASGEVVALSFTDPVNCPPCRTLDASWRTAKPATKRIIIDVRTTKQSQLVAWGVDCWPVTVLVEMEAAKVKKVYRRKLGSMTPSELVKFCEVRK